MSVYDHDRVVQFIGGNDLASAAPGRVTDFVKEHGGHTVITKVRVYTHTP
jgi:acetyl-CoA carboxylase/biotin carboxylase 1